MTDDGHVLRQWLPMGNLCPLSNQESGHMTGSEPITVQGNTDGYRHQAPRCRLCWNQVKTVKWRRFKNGTVHLVWWCCDRQAAGNPIPKKYATELGAEPYGLAWTRLTMEHDQTW